MNKKLISIVVPVFNEELNVRNAYERIIAELVSQLPLYDFEIIFTDNHSTDRTFELLVEIAETDSRVRVIRFTRNFGYQNSILTGYFRARGHAVVQLDCDLQDPPELVKDFVTLWQAGYSVVYGTRVKREEGFVVTSLRKLFYRFLNRISDYEIPLDAGDFRLVDRAVVDEMRLLNDKTPYIRGLIAGLGHKHVGVAYERRARVNGSSKFPISKLMRLSMDAVIGNSDFPIRIITIFGFVVFIASFVGGLTVFLAKSFALLHFPTGYASIVLIMLFSISINAISLGVIGEYLARIRRQLLNAKLAYIEREINSAD